MAALDAAIHENTVVSIQGVDTRYLSAPTTDGGAGRVDGRREAGHDSFDRPINRYRYKSKMLRAENRPYV